jgi:hypothetical protein
LLGAGVFFLSSGPLPGQAPDDLAGVVLRYQIQSVGGTPVRTDTVVVLDVDDTFGELFRQSSASATLLVPRNGDYAYTRTGTNTGDVVLTPGSEAAFTLNLVFDASAGFLTPVGSTGTIAAGASAGTFHLAAATLTAPLVNTSQRGLASDTVPAIVGFVVPPNQTSLVLARAIGPGLAAFAVPLAVIDPRISVYRETTLIAQNNDWDDEPGNKATVGATGSFTGAFPLSEGGTDAALVLLLGPGNYTIQVSGAPGEDPAEVLGELYVVP